MRGGRERELELVPAELERLAPTRPRNSGFRFSTKAERPSLASSDARARKNERRSSSIPTRAASRRLVDRLLRKPDGDGALRRDLALRRASPPRARPLARRPARRARRSRASSAPSRRPLRIMSIATALPTARVRRCVPPAPGITPSVDLGLPELARTPRRRSGRTPSRARSRRRGRSPTRRRRVACAGYGSRPSDRGGGLVERHRRSGASSPMSAPAAKARSLPPSTMQRTSVVLVE